MAKARSNARPISRRALTRGEAAVRAGKTYLIDARVDVRTQDAARGEHTKGRQK